MLQKKKLEDEIAQAFQDVAATHNVVLEKRQRSNDLAANIERLDAALAAGSGWTDDQKESKVCVWLSSVCWTQGMHISNPITIITITIIITRASWRSSVMHCSAAVKPSEQLLMLPASKSAWPQLV